MEADTKTLQFRKIDDTVWACYIRRPARSIYGKAFTAVEGVRVIQERNGSWRADRAEWIGTWAPWVPITNEEFPTADKAKDAVQAWAIGKNATQFQPDAR